MLYESWEDSVKKAKTKAEANAEARGDDLDVIEARRSVPSVAPSARRALYWRAITPLALTAIVSSVLTVGLFKLMSRHEPAPLSLAAPKDLARAESTAPPYTLLQHGSDSAKDVFWIRLREKVSMDAIARFAKEIHRAKRTGKQRSVIWFCLPHVDAYGEGPSFGQPWAFAEIDPEEFTGWKFELRGFSIEQEAEMVALPSPAGADVVGRWLEDTPELTLWTIYRKDGLLYLEENRGPKHASTEEEEIEAVVRDSGGFFKPKKVGSLGAYYYLINGKGDLEIRNSERMIAVCKKVG